MKTDKRLIVCPQCGAQYLPAEIFIPDSVFGHPKEIEKDCYGKIVYYNGEMDTREKYKCDYCGHLMKLEVNLSFNFADDNKKFREESMIKFNNKVSMPET